MLRILVHEDLLRMLCNQPLLTHRFAPDFASMNQKTLLAVLMQAAAVFYALKIIPVPVPPMTQASSTTVLVATLKTLPKLTHTIVCHHHKDGQTAQAYVSSQVMATPAFPGVCGTTGTLSYQLFVAAMSRLPCSIESQAVY